MTGAILAAMIWAALAVGLSLVARRARLWRVGKPEKIDWIAGIAALPRRYLVDVHHVVARDRYVSRMHMLAAGGLLAGSMLAALGFLPVLADAFAYHAVVALCFAAMLAGGLMDAGRRAPPPPKLSRGAFQALPWLLCLYGLGAGWIAVAQAFAAPLAVAAPGLAAAAVGLCGLAGQLGSGPMRHAVTGALHLVAHPRPDRFGGARSSALFPLDLDAQKLGLETPGDFAWNRLLSFDACIQCGRCEIACPAFAAGQPLNPKRLIQDLAAALGPGADAAQHTARYAGSPHPDARAVAGRGGPALPIVGADALVHPDTLWSCTTCRACVEECPMMIEHVDAVVGLRRFQTLELGAVPANAEPALADMREADEPGGRALSARTDFAAGLRLPVIAELGAADLLLWLGEGAYDLRYGRTLRALVRLLERAGADFAVLGAEERDCGDLARRLGDEATFQRLARANIATLGKYRFGRIVTADPHALHVLRNEYPAFGGTFEVVHHTRLLEELAAADRLVLGQADAGRQKITYHDPCYLGRYNGETLAPRLLLDRLGVTRVEMARHGRRSMCCGGGGGASLSDIPGDRRIPDMRMDQARETGAAVVAVACPTCTAMLEGVTGARPRVLDVAELVLQASDAAMAAAPPRRAA